MELGDLRACRWLVRRAGGALADRAPGGSPEHRQLLQQVDQIVALTHWWGKTGRSSRKPAHRGSYLDRLWPSSLVIRVLDAHELRLRPLPSDGHSACPPFPGRITYSPDKIWMNDTTYFSPAGRAAPVIEDLISRRWLTTVASVAETSSSTGQYVAVRVIARRSGRPGTPTNRARTELLFGHVEGELSHLLTIRDSATFRNTRSHRRQKQRGSATSSPRLLSNSDTR